MKGFMLYCSIRRINNQTRIQWRLINPYREVSSSDEKPLSRGIRTRDLAAKVIRVSICRLEKRRAG